MMHAKAADNDIISFIFYVTFYIYNKPQIGIGKTQKKISVKFKRETNFS